MTAAPITFPRPVPLTLAQFNPYDDPPPPPAPPPQRPMSFSDLQQGLRDVHAGKTDDTSYRNAILILLAILAIVVLIIHFRQRRKTAGPPDSLARLGRQLAAQVPFPLGTRLLLQWVALSTRTPFAALLLSSDLFDHCLAQWSGHPTFAAARHWGQARLARLRPILFD